MILVNHYAIWPLIPRTTFIKYSQVEIIALPFMLFHRDFFLNFCCLFRQQFSAAYLFELFLLPQRAHTTLFIRCDKPSLLAGVCAACMLAYRCLQMKWWAAVTVVTIPLQKSLLMCPFVSSSKFSVLAPRCSRAPLHNLQLTSDSSLIFAIQFGSSFVS